MNGTMIKMVAALVGAAISAAPAFATDRPERNNSRNIPCPSGPPVSDIVTSTEGSGGVQILGFGISGSRARVRSETDVILRNLGTEAWNEIWEQAQACAVIIDTHPNNPVRQLQEMTAFRNQQRRAMTAEIRAAAPAQASTAYEDAQDPPSQTESRAALLEALFSAGLRAASAASAAEEPAPITFDVSASAIGEASDTAPVEFDLSPATAQEPQQQPTRSYSSPVTVTYANGCSSGTISTGGTVVMQSCGDFTSSSSSSSCTMMPQTSYLPTIMAGNLMVSGMMFTSTSGSC